MKKILPLAAVLMASCMLVSCNPGKKTEYRTLQVVNYGHTKSRIASLQKAVDTYNEEHPDIQYSVEFNHYMDGVWDWDNYISMAEELLSQDDQDVLLTMPGEYIGGLAQDGYLLPLDDVIADPRFQQEYFTPLLPKTNYLGHTWGLLIEMDMRMAYINKHILTQLGYSKEDMEQLPENVRTGELTLEDLEKIGEMAVNQNLADFAMIHRPRYGTFFYGMAQQFHAFSIHEDETIEFDERNFAEMLRFYQRISSLNQKPQPTEWSETNDVFIQEQAAVYLGDNWTIYDCVMERGGNEEKLLQQYIPCLLPAIHQGDSPFAISNTLQIIASSRCRYPESIKEILANAYSDWDSLASHCAQSYRLPVAASIAKSPSFQENRFQADLMYMMDYTSFMPYNSDNQRWLKALYQAVRSVENGTGTPEEVAHMFSLDLEDET